MRVKYEGGNLSISHPDVLTYSLACIILFCLSLPIYFPLSLDLPAHAPTHLRQHLCIPVVVPPHCTLTGVTQFLLAFTHVH